MAGESTAPTELDDRSAVEDEAVVENVGEDVLVEEVSIDGMCGVY